LLEELPPFDTPQPAVSMSSAISSARLVMNW
jgi:hypothetical protein